MPALHEKRLTRRYLFYVLNLLKGLMGLGLGGLGTFESRGKLGLSSLGVTLQTLMLLHESLELLPNFRHPCLLLFSLSPFRGRTAFGRGHSILQGCHLVSGPCNTHIILVNFICNQNPFL